MSTILGRDSSSSFPATIYLLRDTAVCNDIASAVGNDINTPAIELAKVDNIIQMYLL